MAQLAPIVSLIGTGATLVASQRQNAAARAQDAARAQQLAVQQAAEKRARDARLAGTIASTRARLAAGGVAPDEGSAAALASGIRRDAEAAQSDSDAVFAARLSAGRRSLLNQDGTLSAWLRAGRSFDGALRNLLD